MCIGANSGLRSSKKGIDNEASREETNKRGPQNAMTRNPSCVWPNATVLYKMGGSISNLTKDCSLRVGRKVINLRGYCLVHQILCCLLRTCSIIIHVNLWRTVFQY